MLWWGDRVGRPYLPYESKYNEKEGFCQGFLRFSSFLPFDQIKKVANFVLFISNFQGFWSIRRHKNFTFYTKFMMIFLRFATGGFEAIREAWKQVCEVSRNVCWVWLRRKCAGAEAKKKDPIRQVGSYERTLCAGDFARCGERLGSFFG
ncbi:hypothetical protein [Butyricicoccus pullicaecorum]|uniref:hypothetical protein n=1 Tax=Butyricicoccus pullicaecorum TaxID=501571 RepID=UPI0011C99240|nr:hypothetical protein [Butyricicoccus pullicaecorum]